jgi:hypothetical protein
MLARTCATERLPPIVLYVTRPVMTTEPSPEMDTLVNE